MSGGTKRQTPKNSNRGRKSIYDEKRFPTMAWWLCQKGSTDEEIAKAFGIARSTLNNWKNMFPEFLDAIKNGKDHANSMVVKSLYDSCFDHTVTEAKRVKKRGKSGELEIVVVEEYIKVIPANTLAQQTWLHNRDPENWKRNPSVQQSDDKKDPLDMYLEGIRDAKAETEEQKAKQKAKQDADS